MASPREIDVTLGGRAIPDGDGAEATLGGALERVLEAQQDLVIRRAGLLIEERGTRLVASAFAAALGAAIALAGWFIAIAGLVDALDGTFARYAVEIAVGAIHVAAGLAIVFVFARLRRTRGTP